MNSYRMSYDDLNALLSLIGYYHNKIREGSLMLGENFDMISEDLIAELNEFLEVEDDHLQCKWLQTAA